MRKITTLIFVFVIAASLVGGVYPAFALGPEKSIPEIKAVAEAEGSGECVIDRVTDKLIEVLKDKSKRQKPEVYEEDGTRGDSRYVLLGIGGTTLDPELGTAKPAPAETPKEHEVLPPAEPLTPQPAPQGLGAEPPPVVAPGEAPGREQVKEGTGPPKPVTSKETRKKRKGKTIAERAKKTAKRMKPRSHKTVGKPPESSTARKRAPARRPTAVDVTKSLESKGAAGRRAPRPPIQWPTTPSTRKK